MNTLTETANGLMALTPHEAQMRIEQLAFAKYTTDDADKAAMIQAEIERLKPVADPLRTYEGWGQG